MKPCISIGIDCWALRLNGGGARFVFESLLTEFGGMQQRFTLFLHPEAWQCVESVERRIGLLRNVLKIEIDRPERIFQYVEYFDVLYCPFNNISVRSFDKPLVAVLHDVQEKFLPHLFTQQDLRARHEDYGDILRSADQVITISEFCKASFVDFYEASADRIQVIYNAPQAALASLSNGGPRAVSAGLGRQLITNSYALYPANFYPHKNHRRLLDAYVIAQRRCADLVDLVLVGAAWQGGEDPHKLIADRGLSKRVHVVGDLDAQTLADLYAGCRFVVIPSLFEGFCLPAVEALMFRAPLACSDLPILREVTGGEAVFFNPEDVDGIADALQLLHLGVRSDEAACLRRRDIADRYDWKLAARQTVDVLLNALERRRFDRQVAISSATSGYVVLVVVHMGAPEEWLDLTLQSVENRCGTSRSLRVFVLQEESPPADSPWSRTLLRLGGAAINMATENPGSLLAELRQASRVGVLFSGSELTPDYLPQMVSERPADTEFVLGEVRQVHEDKARTHEMYCYLRFAEDQSVLMGHLFPEMLVVHDPSRVFNDIREWRDVWCHADSVAIALGRNACAVVRRTFATVRHRSRQYHPMVGDAVPALHYCPAPATGMVPLTLLRKQQSLLDFVNQRIAPSLGCAEPPVVTEAMRVLDAEEY